MRTEKILVLTGHKGSEGKGQTVTHQHRNGHWSYSRGGPGKRDKGGWADPDLRVEMGQEVLSRAGRRNSKRIMRKIRKRQCHGDQTYKPWKMAVKIVGHLKKKSAHQFHYVCIKYFGIKISWCSFTSTSAISSVSGWFSLFHTTVQFLIFSMTTRGLPELSSWHKTVYATSFTDTSKLCNNFMLNKKVDF